MLYSWFETKLADKILIIQLLENYPVKEKVLKNRHKHIPQKKNLHSALAFQKK